MKTRILSVRNRHYELVIDDGKAGADRRVLAGMTLYEGTRSWMLVDIRLHPFGTAHEYSGVAYADDIASRYLPESPEEADFVRSRLHTYTEDAEGIRWATFAGLVKGTPRDSPWLARNNHVGYFSRAEGFAYLKELQGWWASFEGNPDKAKISNPWLQPSQTQLFGDWCLHQARQERSLVG